jgi:hypothetical protein
MDFERCTYMPMINAVNFISAKNTSLPKHHRMSALDGANYFGCARIRAVSIGFGLEAQP